MREDLNALEREEISVARDEFSLPMKKLPSAWANAVCRNKYATLAQFAEKRPTALLVDKISEGHARAMLSLNSPQAINAA